MTWYNTRHHDMTNDIRRIWCLMQPPIKQIVILFEIWCEKLMSITLHLTCVILQYGVNM